MDHEFKLDFGHFASMMNGNQVVINTPKGLVRLSFEVLSQAQKNDIAVGRGVREMAKALKDGS